MFYFLVSTCLIQENFEKRKREYIEGIHSLLNNVKDIPNKKIIIIENSGKYKASFLDYFTIFGCEVFYTSTDSPGESWNGYKKNKGRNELVAINNCIKYYNIPEDGFVVKFTGRYFLAENCPFIQCLKMGDFLENFDAIIKYGAFFDKFRSYEKKKDCVTGLIGMRSKYIVSIPLPNNEDCIEWYWAEATFPIPNNRILSCGDDIGLHMTSSGGFTI
jgi:hypothetical protein